HRSRSKSESPDPPAVRRSLPPDKTTDTNKETGSSRQPAERPVSPTCGARREGARNRSAPAAPAAQDRSDAREEAPPSDATRDRRSFEAQAVRLPHTNSRFVRASPPRWAFPPTAPA